MFIPRKLSPLKTDTQILYVSLLSSQRISAINLYAKLIITQSLNVSDHCQSNLSSVLATRTLLVHLRTFFVFLRQTGVWFFREVRKIKKESCENHEQTCYCKWLPKELGKRVCPQCPLSLHTGWEGLADTVISQETCLHLNDYAYTLMSRSGLTYLFSSSLKVCHFIFCSCVFAWGPPSASFYYTLKQK